MINQEVFYEGIEPAACFSSIRDQVIPKITVKVTGRAGIITITEKWRCRVTDYDYDGLTIRVVLFRNYSYYFRLPEFRVYCKPAGSGCLVLARRESKNFYDSSVRNSMANMSAIVARPLLGKFKIDVDGTPFAADDPNYVANSADALIRATVVQLHRLLREFTASRSG